MAGAGILARILLISCCVLVHAQDEIREPPVITEPAVAMEKFYDANADVELQCTARGQPKPMYQWYYNGQVIDSSTQSAITYDSYSGILTIKGLTVREEGFYDCRAKNTFSNGGSAVAISPKIEVRVARIESMPKSTDREKKAVEGSYVSISCEKDLPIYYGPTTFKWYTTDAEERLEEVVQDDRIFIDDIGTLHFTYTVLGDEKQNKFYACAMSNAIEGAIRLGGRTKLIVEKSPGGMSETKPTLKYSSDMGGPEALTFERNNQGRLECVFGGYENSANKVPTIEWIDNAGDVITNSGRYSIERDGRVLIIDNLVEGDEKPYTCRARNKLGTAEKTMLLNVTSAPIWVTPLQSVTVTQGDDAEMECVARSASSENTPNPPRWYRNGMRLDTSFDSNKYTFEDQMTRLRVKGVQKNGDIACYQCYVDNSVGEEFSDGCLNVILPIKVINEPAPLQVVTQGDIVNLTVFATSDRLYPISYMWIFKNKTYVGVEAPPHVMYDPNTMRAFINTTELTDSQMLDIKGVYRRRIYNQFQEEIIDVDVAIEDEPVIVPVVEAGFDYWIIGLIIGVLIIIIVLIIICCVICRRKMREGDYAVDRKETAAGLDPEKELKDSGFHDLSRADYDFLPDKKQPNIDIEEYPLADDESFGSEYAEDEGTAFNEDGSFIGVYSKKKPGGPPGYKPAESNV